MAIRLPIVVSIVLATASSACAQQDDDVRYEPQIIAVDRPNDAGGTIELSWQWPVDPPSGDCRIVRVEPDGSSTTIATVSPPEKTYVDTSVTDGATYAYRILWRTSDGFLQALSSGPVSARPNWFHTGRVGLFVAILACTFAIFGALILGRDRRWKLRNIPALNAVDNALGRATESGTPALYISGWGGDMQRPTTMSSMMILGEIARRSAGLGCRLMFPSHDPIVATVAEETIRQGCTAAGHPDRFRADDVTFVTQSQFGYSAAIDGIMTREKPGAVFLLGTFEGEALLLAETANTVGASTIGGTDSTIQLSFFLVACDYTLIGEELFAAAGILADDRRAISAIVGQDWLKLAILLLLGAGALGMWMWKTNLATLLQL